MESTASNPPPPTETTRSPSVFGFALLCAFWAAAVHVALLPRWAGRGPQFPRTPAEFAALAILLACVFAGAVLYQLVLRGWARRAGSGERFLWGFIAPAAVVTLTLFVAAIR